MYINGFPYFFNKSYSFAGAYNRAKTFLNSEKKSIREEVDSATRWGGQKKFPMFKNNLPCKTQKKNLKINRPGGFEFSMKFWGIYKQTADILP